MGTASNKSEVFQWLVNNRQSVRAYKPDMVEKDKIDRIVEAGRIAPSACNAQPWKFIVVDDPELKNKIADATSNRVIGINHFTKQAPVHIVVVLESANFNSNFGSLMKDKNLPLIDIGITTAQMCLQATAEGLGTCILGWFNERTIKKLLDIPKSKRVILVITLGYAANDELREKKRKTTDEVVSINKY
ncbi:MAG: nitroreductase [Bacteroidales bacterium]|nr:MAG: nitroreductase [Bacteroidales bacterium]